MPFATRLLRFRDGDAETEIPIRIFAPEPDGNAWICPYEIGWPHGTWKSKAAGFDAVQALLLALQKIGAELYTSEYHASGGLIWTAPGQGYGFPVPRNISDLLVGEDRIYGA